MIVLLFKRKKLIIFLEKQGYKDGKDITRIIE